MEVLKDGVIKTLTSAHAGETGMAIGIVNLSLLRIAEHAVGFGAFAKFGFRFGLIRRVTVRMPFQRGLAVSGLDFLHRRSA